MPKLVPKTDLILADQCAANPQDTHCLKMSVHPPPQKICNTILQLLELGIISSFKYYCSKKVTIKTLSLLNNKVVFDTTIMKMYVLDAQNFIAELRQHVYVTVVNCSQKCEFGLNSCSEGETELSIAKDGWCQLRAARISCHCRL